MYKFFLNSAGKWRLIWRFIFGIVLFLLINVPLQIVIQKLFSSGLTRSNLSTTAVFFAVAGGLYFQVRFFDKSTFMKYGFELGGKWFKEFAFGCTVAALQISLFFAMLYWMGQLTIVDKFIITGSHYSFAGGFISEMYRQLLVGIFEELISRVFLFFIIYEMLKSLKVPSTTSIIASCILNSLVFGILHLDNVNSTWLSAFNLVIDASTLCIPFLLTGRLGMSIGMHFSWNFVQGAVFGFANSGTDVRASILEIQLSNHPITGGEFGPEGSTVLVGLSAISFILIYCWKRSNKIKTWIHPKLLTYGVCNVTPKKVVSNQLNLMK